MNKALKAIREVCDRFPRDVEVKVIGIVNGAKAVCTDRDHISIEYGEGSTARYHDGET